MGLKHPPTLCEILLPELQTLLTANAGQIIAFLLFNGVFLLVIRASLQSNWMQSHDEIFGGKPPDDLLDGLIDKPSR